MGKLMHSEAGEASGKCCTPGGQEWSVGQVGGLVYLENLLRGRRELLRLAFVALCCTRPTTGSEHYFSFLFLGGLSTCRMVHKCTYWHRPGSFPISPSLCILLGHPWNNLIPASDLKMFAGTQFVQRVEHSALKPGTNVALFLYPRRQRDSWII